MESACEGANSKALSLRTREVAKLQLVLICHKMNNKQFPVTVKKWSEIVELLTFKIPQFTGVKASTFRKRNDFKIAFAFL